MKRIITNVIIILIIIFQLGYFYKHTTADNLIDLSVNEEANDMGVVHTNMLLDILLEDIDMDQKYNFFIIYNSKTAPYREYGVGYMHFKWEIFPSYIPTIGEYKVVNATPKYKDIIGKNYDLDYVIVMGKNTKIGNCKTKYDLTLLHLDDKENNDYSIVGEIDYSLYSLYKSHRKEFNEIIDNMQFSAKHYGYLYSVESLKNLVLDAYEDDNYKIAKKYGKFYLENLSYFDVDINTVLAEIAYKDKKYDDSKKYFDICLNNLECDLSDNYIYSIVSTME